VAYFKISPVLSAGWPKEGGGGSPTTTTQEMERTRRKECQSLQGDIPVGTELVLFLCTGLLGASL
jgi:hypothetical protein